MAIKKLKSAIMVLTISVLMIGCSNVLNKNEIVANVSGNDITLEYFEKTLNLQKQAIESTYGEDIWDKEVEKGKKFKDGFKETVINQITTMDTIYEEAKKEKILPTEDEINERFELVKKSIDSNEQYKKDLEENGIDDEFIKNQQAKDLAIEKYKEKFYEDVKVSDEEAKSYYDDNKDEFYIEQVKASHILIPTQDESGKPFSEEQIKEANKKAQDILQKVKSGGNFEQLAKENSSCSSSENGGDLGYFGKGQMVEEFEKVAFSLDKGEISEVVETNYGYHIIKLTDKKGEQRVFEEVRDYIKMQIKNEKFDENIEKISKKANIKVNKDILDKVEF